MTIEDGKVSRFANVAKECITFALGTTAISQTGKRTDGITPGFNFQVVAVEVYALTVTATISVDVQIGSTSVLSSVVTPVADTPTAGVLSTTLANLRGTSTSVLSLKYTSNGSGAATNGFVRVWIRPRPMHAEGVATA